MIPQLNACMGHRSPRTLVMTLCVLCGNLIADAELSGSAAYSFDGFAAHNAQTEVGLGLSLAPALTIGGTIQYLDAVQEPIAGIRRLRGQVISGLFDVSWRTLRNHLLLDIHAGADAVMGWQVQPRGSAKLEATLPLPPTPVIQNIKITPQGWYRHYLPNGPAVANRVVSYGYSAEIGATMGAKGALAANFSQEFLQPANSRLDTSFIDTGIIHYYHDHLPAFSLKPNAITSFYAYIYRQVLKPLYLGYAFSWTDSRNDRRVMTSMEQVQQIGQIMPDFKTQSAYYPYPTPIEMLAHIVSITLNFRLGQVVNWKSNAAIPVYSRQKLHFLPPYESGPRALTRLLNPDQYEYYEEEFTGPLSMESSVTWHIMPPTSVTVSYDYFGFPYKSWAYFTKDSYSLHTLKLSITQRL